MNNNLIWQFCLQDINNHAWNCPMNPININNNEFQLNKLIDKNKEIKQNIYHLSWLEIAIDNFKKQNEIVHVIDGNMTVNEFLLEYAKEEISKIIKC